MVNGIGYMPMRTPVSAARGNVNVITGLTYSMDLLKNRLIAEERSMPNNAFILEIINTIEDKFALLKANAEKMNPTEAATLKASLDKSMMDNDLSAYYNALGELEERLIVNA